MIIYQDKLSSLTFPLLQRLFPAAVQRQIGEIIDLHSGSEFYCKVEENTPGVSVYLIEYNPAEGYSLCHFVAYDQIGEDFLYQSLPVEYVEAAGQFISQLPICQHQVDS